MSNELARANVARALIVADALTQEAEQRKLLGEYVSKHMANGTDYGVIPGTKNKTLLKPGAEKLTQLFRCTPRFTIEEKIEDWDKGLFFYRFSCQVVTQADDVVVAEGVGSCSSYEKKYRWRMGERTCPSCGAAAIIKGNKDFGGGWLCWKKKDGCGAKFADNDPAITSQEVGRVQNPDIIDSANTVLKMAKKRALVDAAIALARCSDIFTQDLEDHEPEVHPEPDPANTRQAANAKISRATRDEYEAKFAAARTRDEVDAIGKSITPGIKDLMVEADLKALRAAMAKAKDRTAEPEMAGVGDAAE